MMNDCDLSEFRVELLRDDGGVYGLGSNKPESTPQSSIITRPDRVEPTTDHIAYQMIIPNHVVFKHTKEHGLFSQLHCAMLERHGIKPKGDGLWNNLWRPGMNTRESDKNRRAYHGLKKLAGRIVNHLITDALRVSDHRAIAATRRFRIRYRGELYAAFCKYGIRAVQLAETFPALAIRFFTTNYGDQAFREEGCKMILRGDRLKLIAEMAKMPMALRHVKPRAVGFAITLNHKVPENLIYAYLPKTTEKQRIWLAAVRYATHLGPDFTKWTAKNIIGLGARRNEAHSQLIDIADWVKARVHIEWGCDFITRPFSEHMSVNTVSRLSNDWHEAVATGMKEGNLKIFPEPWFDGAEIENYTIVPIKDSAEMYGEGRSMHNCIATYFGPVLDGCSYIYSVRQKDTRVANFELTPEDGISLGQLRGPCNSMVGKDIENVVRRWLNANKRKHGRGKLEDLLKTRRERKIEQHVPLNNDDDFPF